MDPLSEVLSLLTPGSYAAGGFQVDSALAVQFARHEGIKCYAVVSGALWLAVEGVKPVLMAAGDCVLLARGRPFRLATDLSLPPVDSQALRASRRAGTAPQGDGPFVVGGYFFLSGRHADFLLEALPPVVHLRGDAAKAALRWSLERLVEELRDPQPGGSLIARQLASMMLVQALRLHLADRTADTTASRGWLAALADPQLHAAIACMHERPAQRWTVEALARHVGMSRSIFAVRFKEKVGETPMAYLTRWRMLLAGHRLRTTDDSISEVALSLGYASEGAFRKAFKSVMGAAPRDYGRA